MILPPAAVLWPRNIWDSCIAFNDFLTTRVLASLISKYQQRHHVVIAKHLNSVDPMQVFTLQWARFFHQVQAGIGFFAF